MDYHSSAVSVVIFYSVETHLEMAGHVVSLQQLLDRFHLSRGRRSADISEEHLTEASKIIDDHEVVGPRLGLTPQEMTAIDRDARTHELKKKAMLRKWKQKLSLNATYRTLTEALLKCSRADHAQDVCELLAQSEFFWILTFSVNTVVWRCVS